MFSRQETGVPGPPGCEHPSEVAVRLKTTGAPPLIEIVRDCVFSEIKFGRAACCTKEEELCDDEPGIVILNEELKVVAGNEFPVLLPEFVAMGLLPPQPAINANSKNSVLAGNKSRIFKGSPNLLLILRYRATIMR